MDQETLFQDRVRERDLDNFLVEELHASAEFRNWMLARLEPRFVIPTSTRIKVGKSPQRLQDNRQTDVRLGWYDADDELVACVLIESKVTADFQPGQAASYGAELQSWRDILGAHAACAVIVAPAAKFASLIGRELFDDRLAIEEIVEFLRGRRRGADLADELSDRLEARSQLLEALIGKRQSGIWTPITMPQKREFSEHYERLAKQVVPGLSVRHSTDGAGATTKFFEGAALPTNFPSVKIKHEFGKKVEVKYANLQFDGLGHLEDALKKSGLTGGTEFRVVGSGKSLFVRRNTPGVDPLMPFGPQRERVAEGLSAVRDLVAWLQSNAAAIAAALSAPGPSAPNNPQRRGAAQDRIEREMRAALLHIYEECSKFGYRPNYLLEMMEELGAVAAVKRLITKPISEGFVRLAEENHLELSAEALALEPRWEGVFNAAELAECRRRLGKPRI